MNRREGEKAIGNSKLRVNNALISLRQGGNLRKELMESKNEKKVSRVNYKISTDEIRLVIGAKSCHGYFELRGVQRPADLCGPHPVFKGLS